MKPKLVKKEKGIADQLEELAAQIRAGAPMRVVVISMRDSNTSWSWHGLSGPLEFLGLLGIVKHMMASELSG
jgi:hypothetical protein